MGKLNSFDGLKRCDSYEHAVMRNSQPNTDGDSKGLAENASAKHGRGLAKQFGAGDGFETWTCISEHGVRLNFCFSCVCFFAHLLKHIFLRF